MTGAESTRPSASGGADSPPEDATPQRYFEFTHLEPPNHPLWDSVQRLRYEVYCLECQYLEAASYPSARETDEYDPCSIHFAATNERKEMVATLRLVRDSPLRFPLESHVRTLSPEFSRLPRNKTAEISRLILARSYRRRANDGLYGADVGDPEGHSPAELTYRRSQYPLILFGLFREMYVESLSIGLEYWLAAMEPGLQRMLSRFGLGLKQIGEPMSYYGQVIPYYASIEELSRFVMESRPDVFKFFGTPASPA